MRVCFLNFRIIFAFFENGLNTGSYREKGYDGCYEKFIGDEIADAGTLKEPFVFSHSEVNKIKCTLSF